MKIPERSCRPARSPCFICPPFLTASNLNLQYPFFRLKMHQETRSRKIVNILHRYDFSVSYDTVLAIIASFSRILCDKAKTSEIVCPSNLKQHLFTVAALDNLDQNPTSRTATSSFHGTGISIFQFPTHENPGLDQKPIIISARSRWTVASRVIHIPTPSR